MSTTTVCPPIELSTLATPSAASSTFPAFGSESRLERAEDDDAHRGGFAALPPVDGGRAAWLFLGAAFMVETLVWGLPFSVVSGF
jgi:hypothetical protein